jgi:hypothetical protein
MSDKGKHESFRPVLNTVETARPSMTYFFASL